VRRYWQRLIYAHETPSVAPWCGETDAS
jgi:hypothetical protein